MALSFSGLTAYTKQLVKPLLTSAVFDATTQKLIMAALRVWELKHKHLF